MHGERAKISRQQNQLPLLRKRLERFPNKSDIDFRHKKTTPAISSEVVFLK